jgi:hypothetical protein
MAEGYAMEESMGFLMEYMQDFMLVSWRVWDVKKGVSGEVLEGVYRSIYLDLTIWDVAHHYVTNTTTMAWWVKKIVNPNF